VPDRLLCVRCSKEIGSEFEVTMVALENAAQSADVLRVFYPISPGRAAHVGAADC
jgi:hypothetical protein